MTEFELFIQLSDEEADALFSELPMDVLLPAMHRATPEMKVVLERELSPIAYQQFLEELALMGSIPEREVYQAREEIVRLLERLDEGGMINLAEIRTRQT